MTYLRRGVRMSESRGDRISNTIAMVIGIPLAAVFGIWLLWITWTAFAGGQASGKASCLPEQPDPRPSVSISLQSGPKTLQAAGQWVASRIDNGAAAEDVLCVRHPAGIPPSAR